MAHLTLSHISHATKRLATASLIIIGMQAHSAWAQEDVSVATVNDQTIYLDEVMQVAENLPEQYRRQPLDTYFDQLIDEVVNTRLAATAAKEEGLESDPLLQRAIAIATNRILAEAYMAVEVRKMVTEEEIKDAYDRFVSDSDSREEVSARHILVDTEEEAKGLITKLSEGADFAELAKEFSTGPSGPNGGALGYFGRGQMVPDFEVAAFNLEIGTYTSAPVQTQFGWHVILLEDKRTAQPASLEEMREQIGTALSQQALARLIEEMRADATIEARSFEDVRADAIAQRDAQ